MENTYINPRARVRFDCDYVEGAHPHLLERLVATNLEQMPGYGQDDCCERARGVIRKLCSATSENMDIHFFTGGTLANLTVIAAALAPHQGVLCADTGHIHTHETGSVEATGHKLLPMPAVNGKLTPQQIHEAHCQHQQNPGRVHTVQPAMVYLSQSTECGTVYSAQELSEISRVCRSSGLLLYMDGARLGYALASRDDLGFEHMARCCDAFTIGATKGGALMGEAVVLTNSRLREVFSYHVKQRGAMLAKGRLLGIQFEALLEDGLYLELASHAVKLAGQLAAAFERRGYPMHYPVESNQLFPVLTPIAEEELEENFVFTKWEALPNSRLVVRLCTSWATDEANVRQLTEAITKLPQYTEHA